MKPCATFRITFDNFFLRFFTLPLKRITTSCSYTSPEMMMLPNAVPSMAGLIAGAPFFSPTTLGGFRATSCS